MGVRRKHKRVREEPRGAAWKVRQQIRRVTCEYQAKKRTSTRVTLVLLSMKLIESRRRGSGAQKSTWVSAGGEMNWGRGFQKSKRTKHVNVVLRLDAVHRKLSSRGNRSAHVYKGRRVVVSLRVKVELIFGRLPSEGPQDSSNTLTHFRPFSRKVRLFVLALFLQSSLLLLRTRPRLAYTPS